MKVLDFVFVIHILLLFSISLLTIKNWLENLNLLATFCFAYLIGWGNILVTSFLLSALSQLNSIYLYFLFSIGIQSLAIFFLRYTRESPLDFRIADFNFRYSKLDFLFLMQAFLSTVIFLQLILCFNYIPLTPDTLSMKLVKIYSYISNNRLVPNPDFDGGLLYISPLNSAATWLIFIKYQISLKSLLFFSLFNWLILIMVSYLLCISFSFSKVSSMFATITLLCSNSFIMNASGDNDDILAASSFALAVLAFRYFLVKSSKGFLLLSGMALGIHLGIKPFAALYGGLALFLVIYFIATNSINEIFFFLRRNLNGFLLFVTTLLILCSGVMIENFSVRGNPIKFSNTMNILRNSPFDLRIAGINFTTQNLEIFAAPFLNPTGFEDRQDLAIRTNNFAKELILKLFGATQEEVLNKISAHFNYTSITDSLFYDHSVNFGLYPHLLIISLLLAILNYKSIDKPLLVLGLSFVFADIGYCFINKYISTIMRYWMIIFSITAPIVAYAYSLVSSGKSRLYLLLRVSFFSVFIYIVFSSFYCLFNNHYRSLAAIYNHKSISSYEEAFEPRVYETLRKVKVFNILYVHNYANAIIHYLAPDSRILSKLEIQPNIPNLVLSQPLKLGMTTYSQITRYHEVELPFLKTGFFTHIGNGFGTRFLISALDKDQLKAQDKKILVIAFKEPIDLGDSWSTSIDLPLPFENSESLEFRFSEENSEGRLKLLRDWASFKSTSLNFKKDSRSLRVDLRKQGTDEIFSSEIRI